MEEGLGETLETPRLILRPMRAEDSDALLGIFADPVVMASFGHPPFDRVSMDNWVRRNLDHQDMYGYGLFSVLLRENGLLVGDCGLERMTVSDKDETELGFDFQSDYWNRGLATEAAIAVRDYAFATLGLPRLISLIRSSNAASRRVAEKVGMHPERQLMRAGHEYWVYALGRNRSDD